MSENMIQNVRFVQASLALSKVIVEEIQQLYELGLRVGVLFESIETLRLVDNSLWTQKQISFIPHATQEDADQALQPIYLTSDFRFPNDPQVLLCVECVPFESAFEQEVIIFSSTSSSLGPIRLYYKSLMNSACKVSFVKQ